MPIDTTQIYDPNAQAYGSAISNVAAAMFGSPEQDAKLATTRHTMQETQDLQRKAGGRDSVANLLSGVNDYSNINQLKPLMPAIAKELAKSGIDPKQVFESLQGAMAYGGGGEADLYRANAALGHATSPGTAYTFDQGQHIRAEDFANNPSAVKAGIMHDVQHAGVMSPLQSQLLNGGSGAAQRPIPVTPNNLDAFLYDVASGAGGLTDGKNPTADPNFLAQIPAENLSRAEQIFGTTLQDTNSYVAAKEAGMKALGLPAGATYQPAESHIFGSDDPAMLVDSAGQALKFSSPTVGASAPATPAAAPMALPPIETRKPGMIYKTPKGDMEWTGTGWKPSTGEGS